MEYKGVHFESCPLCGGEVDVGVMKIPALAALTKDIEENFFALHMLHTKSLPEFKVAIRCLSCGCSLNRSVGFSIDSAERYDAEQVALESASAFWNHRHVNGEKKGCGRE